MLIQKTMLHTMGYMRDTVLGIQKKVSLEELKTASQSLMEAMGNMMEVIGVDVDRLLNRNNCLP